MQLLALPPTRPRPPDPAQDGLKAHVLLVGGNKNDWDTFNAKLKSRSIGVSWQWANRTAGHRDFPRCDAVIVFTRAASHSLFYNVNSLAKAAKVPVISHDSWPRTLEALDLAGIGTPPVKEAPVPDAAPVAPTPVKKFNAPADDINVIITTQATWDALPLAVRDAVREAARNADESKRLPMHVQAREHLRTYAGNPRAFIVTVLLATPEPVPHMTQSGVIRLYRDVVGRKAEPALVNSLASKMHDLLGPEYGLRVGELTNGLRTLNEARSVVLSALAGSTLPTAPPIIKQEPPVALPPTPAPVPPVVAPTPPIVATPPVVPVTTSEELVRVRARFERMLHYALDAGETLTVTKVEGAYALVYEDGTLVTIRNR